MSRKKPRFLPLESKWRKAGFPLIAGLDEVGRGPFAGPVVCAAVILPKRLKLSGLNDSKLLSASQREILDKRIRQKCDVGVGMASAAEIDSMGLIKACEKAFKLAVRGLKIKPDFLLIDGRDHFEFSLPFLSIIRGDSRVRSIAAASIVAKVFRDKLMCDLAEDFPNYAFEKHKGYGTKLHKSLLRRYGPCKIHRRSFRPVGLALSRKSAMVAL